MTPRANCEFSITKCDQGAGCEAYELACDALAKEANSWLCWRISQVAERLEIEALTPVSWSRQRSTYDRT